MGAQVYQDPNSAGWRVIGIGIDFTDSRWASIVEHEFDATPRHGQVNGKRQSCDLNILLGRASIRYVLEVGR